MINLAGVKTCDQDILKEMREAGIEPVEIGKRDRSEVPTDYIGKCNNFIFKRAWYYWMVSGNMPLQHAKEMYEKHKDLQIRVAGHCGNPPPEEWCEPKDLQEKCRPLIERVYAKELTWEQADELCKEIRKQGDQYVTHYHIDTQEGLNKFVEIIKANSIIG